MLQRSTYVNTATSGLLSQDLLEWRQEHDLDFLIGGSMAKAKTHILLEKTRKTVAQFFNFKEEHVALVPSFSQGLNLLLEGLDPSEKILLLQGDYPSLNWPFESRGFALEYLLMQEDLEAQIYNTVKNRNITIFACSAVQWRNGFKIDLGFFKKLKTDFPELVIVMDATQFCGTEYFDFEDSGVAILGSSGYKWLLAGYGNGFMMVKPEVQNRFTLKSRGYGSGRNAKDQNDGRTFCKQLEPGHLDSLCFGSLEFSMRFLMGIGLETIGEHNRELSQYTKGHLAALGLLEDAIVNRKTISTIFSIKGKDNYDKLLKNNVLCARRGDGTRLSFHFYNTKDEVDRIIEILKK
ncbi:MAG: aminotransferase class V-fold PLP-dependent enzyme [Bacteroidota bacterium]